MVRHFQVRYRTGPDGLPTYDCFRFNQFSGIKAGGYESSAGIWVEGFEPDATNDTDGTPIGTPDADLAKVADGSDPVLAADTDGALYLEEGTGPEPEGEAYSTTPTWP